jgi:hypothetical protein
MDNKTDCHDINEILFEVMLNTITLNPYYFIVWTHETSVWWTHETSVWWTHETSVWWTHETSVWWTHETSVW